MITQGGLTLEKNEDLVSVVKSSPILVINCHFLKQFSKKYFCLCWRAA